MERKLDIYKAEENRKKRIQQSQVKSKETSNKQPVKGVIPESKIRESKNGKIKRFFRASAVVFLGASMLLGGGLYSHSQQKDYANWNQIEEISKALDCDMSYMLKVRNKAIKTFQHNNGEPIYVSLPSGATETTYEAIKNSLDYMFGVMGQINPNYYYKIVSESELSAYKAQGKSTIEFKRSERPLVADRAAEATAEAETDLTSIFTRGKMVDNYKITYDANSLEDKYESLEKSCETFLHELLHVFSFDDIYEKDNLYANTFIHPSMGEKYDVFFPNDLKCLISTYAPKFNNDKEKNEFLIKMKQLVSNYEEDFYRDIIAGERRKTTVNIESDELSLVLRDEVKRNKNTYNYYYKIEIKDGAYIFEIYDNNKNLIDKTSGEALLIDGVYVLKNAHLEYGLSAHLDRALNGEIAMIENLITDLRIQKYKKAYSDEEYSCLLTNNFTGSEHCVVEASKGFESSNNLKENTNDQEMGR